MESMISHLHPNPGWPNDVNRRSSQLDSSTSTKRMIGKHCILELYECDRAKLDDEAFIRTTIQIASKVSGAHLLNLITHRFAPQGVTCLALLAESHISIHTWPESGYAAVDVFTCGDHTMPDKACELLAQELQAKDHSLKTLRRDTSVIISNALTN